MRWTRAVKLAGAAIGGAAVWRAWQRRRLQDADRASDDRARATGLAQTAGIGTIDPEPITQISAEGIDLDAPTTPPPRLDDVIGAGVRDRSSTS